MWYYFSIAIGVLVILLVVVILYTHGQRRAMKKRRRQAERSEMHISDPVEGTFPSLMGNTSVDVVPLNTRTTGKPQLKANILHAFNEEERLKNTFQNSNYGEDSDNALGPFEDYVNTNGLAYGQDSCAMVSQLNCKGNRNINTNAMPARVGNAGLRKKPFIPPAISAELVRKQSERDYQIDIGNQKKTHGALLPDWERGKEELLYENQNSVSVRAAKSLDNFRAQGAEQQPLYVNNTQAKLMKKEKSAENFSRNHLAPELPAKQKLRRADGFEAQTKTWEKERNPDYENFLGGDDCVGGSQQRGAIYHKNKNRAYIVGQGATAINQKDGADYENAPSFEGNLLPRKQEIPASCGLQAAPKVTLLESRRRSPGFTRQEHKAVRRSRTNVEAMLESAYRNEAHSYGKGFLESREKLNSENHKTNTESLMHLLGLPVNLACSEQVQTYEEDDTYLPMDDYDDNRA